MQIKITDLEMILVYAKAKQEHNTDASGTLVFTLIEETDAHLGSDIIKIEQKSNYAEANNINLAATIK